MQTLKYFYRSTDLDYEFTPPEHTESLIRVGTFNAVSRYSNWVRKDNCSNLSNRFKIEIAVLRKLYRFGFTPYPLVDIPEENNTLQGYVEGKQLSEIKNKSIYFKELAPILRKLHSVKVQGYGPLDLKLTKDIQFIGAFKTWRDYIYCNLDQHLAVCAGQAKSITIPEWKKIIAVFDGFNFRDFAPSLLHNDLSNDNIFVTKEGLKIIDFEEVIGGDAIFELAFWATFNPQRYYEPFVNTYYQGKVPKTFWKKFWVYYLRVSIMKSVCLNKNGFVDYSKRIQLALKNL